jgi:hypothetical protein
MKYRLIIQEPNKDAISKEIDTDPANMKKQFSQLKRKHKGSSTLMVVYKFVNGNWIGFLRN